MNNLKPFWGANYDYMEGSILVFAQNKREAKMLTFKHFPAEIEWIDVRVKRAPLKWIALYDGSKYYDSYKGDYETWEEFWNAEMEGK